jgi:hypothetical protein
VVNQATSCNTGLFGVWPDGRRCVNFHRTDGVEIDHARYGSYSTHDQSQFVAEWLVTRLNRIAADRGWFTESDVQRVLRDAEMALI